MAGGSTHTRNWNLLFLAAIAVTAVAWLVAWNPLAPHQPAYRQPEQFGAALPRLAPRVLFVLIDGLRYDVSEHMTCLQQLAAQGARARSIVALPSMSQAMWTTLLSGATPELFESGLDNAADDAIQPIAVDQLFFLSKRAGLHTALAGAYWWQKMIPPADLDQSHFVADFEKPGDAEASEAAAGFLRDGRADFVLLYMGDYDEVSHDYGALSAQARASAAQIDAHLCRVLQAVDLAETVVIVTADHGHVDAGGHGGDEPAVLETPLVMAGRGVRAGLYAPVRNVDIAPTVAALLGTSLPRSSQGRILYDWLDVPAGRRAQGEEALAVQQAAFSGAYLASIGRPPLPAGMVARPESPARILQAVADERADALRQSRFEAMAPALIGLALFLALAFYDWRAGERLALLLGAACAAAFDAVYLARGHTFSLSTMIGMDYLLTTVLLATGAALATGLAALLLARRASPASLAVCYASAAGLALLQALAASAVSGHLGTWYVLDATALFVLLQGLVQAAVVALAGLLVVALSAAALSAAASRALQRG